MTSQTSPAPRPLGAAPVLFLALFAVQSTVFVLPPLAATVARDLGVSVAAVGELRALSGLVAGITTLVVARRTARHSWSLQRLLALGLAASAVGSVAAGLAPTFGVLAAAHVALGLGLGLTVAAATAAAAAWAGAEGRHTLLSRAMMGPPTAAILTTVLAGLLAGVGWRAAWLLVPGAASLLAVAMILRRPREHAAAAPKLTSRAWALPGVRGWLLGELLAYAAWSIVVVFSPPLLIESYGVSPAAAAGGVAASAAVFMVGIRLTRPWLAQGRALLLVLALLLAVAGGTLGWYRHGYWTSVLVLVLLGALQGGRSLAGSAFGLHVAPEQRLDTMALRSTAQQFGYLLGAGLGGVVLSTTGYTGLGSLMAVTFVLASLPHALALLRPQRAEPWSAATPTTPSVAGATEATAARS